MALGVALLVFGGAAVDARAATTLTASTPSAGTAQLIGSSLDDVVTAERIEGTRTVKFTANRSITATGGCTNVGKQRVDCVVPPFALNAVQPELGVIFGGVPVIATASLREGNDTLTFLRSGVQQDTRFTGIGDAGNDTITADALMAGASGVGNRSGAVLIGGDGNDTLTGGPGLDRFLGGGDDDQLRGLDGDDHLEGGDGDDHAIGGAGNDRMFGGAGDDVLLGQSDDDQLIGGFGGDVLGGGAGRDTVQYLERVARLDLTTTDPIDVIFETVARRGVQVAVGDGQCTDGGPEDVAVGSRAQLRATGTTCGETGDGVQRDEVFGDVEILIGTAAPDVLLGGASGDTLDGQAGADQLEGAAGSDSLLGGEGEDTMLLRDAAGDVGAVCGPGIDRVLADLDDPADPSCEKVDRGDLAAPPATGGATVLPVRPSPIVQVTDGTSNTVIVGEVPRAPGPATDGTSNTVLIGESGQPTGAVISRPTDGSSNTIVVGPTDGSGPFIALPPALPPAGQIATEVTILTPGAAAGDAPLATPVTVPAPAPAGSPPTGEHTGGPGPGGGDAGATPPEARIVSRTVSVDRRGRTRVLVTCVYRAKACRGTLVLRATATLRKGARRVAAGGVLARHTVEIPWGRTESVALQLTPAARAVVRGRRTTVRIEATVRDGSASAGAKARRLTQRVPLAGR